MFRSVPHNRISANDSLTDDGPNNPQCYQQSPINQVKIDHAVDSTGGLEADSTVTVEISVSSETDGNAVLTYIMSVVEGSSTSAGQGGLTAALNTALERRTTDNCMCVATTPGAYDCSTCEEGEPFSTAESARTSPGGYDIFSTEGFGRRPVSVFESDNSEGDDDAFWSDFTGGKQIRAVIRTDTYAYLSAVVLAIVGVTCMGGFSLRWCRESTDAAPTQTIASPRRSKTGSGYGAPSVADRKKQQRRTTPERKPSDNRTPLTPGVTPAPGRNV